MLAGISDEQWAQFEKEGYVRLGKVMSDNELAGLQQRIDDIMLGIVKVHDQMFMQLDSETGDYSEKRITTRGHQVSTLNYRKIQDLEFDPLFLSYMQKPVFPRYLREGVRSGDADILLSGHVHEQAGGEGYKPSLASGPVQHSGHGSDRNRVDGAGSRVD